MRYYVLTSRKDKQVAVEKTAGKGCFDFIMWHSDAKVRIMDYHASPKILERRKFIQEYFKNTGDENSTFELAEKMIAGKNNILPLISLLGLTEQYVEYREVNRKNL